MLRLGMQNDLNYARYLFWRGVMRLAGWLDVRLVKLHDAAHLRAARCDRRAG